MSRQLRATQLERETPAESKEHARNVQRSNVLRRALIQHQAFAPIFQHLQNRRRGMPRSYRQQVVPHYDPHQDAFWEEFEDSISLPSRWHSLHPRPY